MEPEMPPEAKTIAPNGAASDRQPAHRVFIILRKEFREIFRDRRTVMSVVISPLLITPALFALMGIMIRSQTEKEKTKTYSVGVVGIPQEERALLTKLKGIPSLRIESISASEAEARIRDRRLNAVAVFPKDTASLLREGHSVHVEIMEDAGEEASQSAAQRLNAAFTKLSEQFVAQRLQENHLPTDYATPFRVTEKPIETGGSSGSFFLAMMLPYILVISSFSGAIYAAFDQVAGEKERGTLETLLVSPASRRDIVLGKFGAVVGVCLISSLLTIVGLIIPFSSGMHAFAWLSKGGLHLSPAAVLVTLLVLLPLAVLFAGLLLAVSTFARNQKEAQTYLAPLFIVVLMPAMMSMFIGTDVARQMALIPILGASVIIKQALSGTYDPLFILLAFVASITYAALALTFATRLFQKESVLIKA
jgi:sodium transport system permease protein